MGRELGSAATHLKEVPEVISLLEALGHCLSLAAELDTGQKTARRNRIN
jgi:hypothetical protein